MPDDVRNNVDPLIQNNNVNDRSLTAVGALEKPILINVRIDVNSLLQNNNGNDNSLTGVGALEKSILINAGIDVNSLLQNNNGNDNSLTGVGALEKSILINAGIDVNSLLQNNNGNDNSLTGVGALEKSILINAGIDVNSLLQNNNGNNKSLTGVGAEEIPITDVLAKTLGVLVCGWVVLVLLQGGMVGSLETKDCRFVTLLFFLVFFRCWRHYCPQVYRSLTEAIRSLSADYCRLYIDILFYWSKLIFAMCSIVPSIIRLASQDFGKKEVANKEPRDFVLNVFYGLTFAEALLFALRVMLSFRRDGCGNGRGNGPGDGRGNGRGNGPGDGRGNGPGDGRGNGPGDGRGNGPGDGRGNGPGDGRGDGRGNGLGDGRGNGPGDGRANGPPGGEAGDGTIMPDHDVRIDMIPDQQQPSSDSITDLLENKVAAMLVVLVLAQGLMVAPLEKKDGLFVIMLFSLAWLRFCFHQALGYIYRWSLTSADYLSVPNNTKQLALPSFYIRRLLYWSKFVSTIISVILSVTGLASQYFGKKEVTNMESGDFDLKVFYGLTLTEALVLLFALTLSFPKKRNSVALADGPGDGPEDSPGNGPGDGPGDGPEDGPEDGSENGPGGEPGDGSGDGPVNQSMDRPANESNDFKSEGPAVSLPNLRKRRKEIPQNHNSSVSKVGMEMIGVNRRELLEQSRKEE